MANKGNSKNEDENLYKKVAMVIDGATRLVSRVAGTKTQVQSGTNTMTNYLTSLQVLNTATPVPPNNKRRKRVSLLYHLVSTNKEQALISHLMSLSKRIQHRLVLSIIPLIPSLLVNGLVYIRLLTSWQRRLDYMRLMTRVRHS